MTRYRKRPVEIEAVEYGPDTLPPDGVEMRLRGNRMEVYNALHDSWIAFKHGDMLRIDAAPEDVYPIDRETFNATYEPVRP